MVIFLKKILVVEDDIILGLEYKVHLQSLGYEVFLVRRFKKALEILRELIPDAILLDVNLSGTLDGIDLAAVIKNRYDIPVVFISAHSGDEIIGRITTLGAVGYLVKPVKFEDLKMTLALCLSQHAKKQFRTKEYDNSSLCFFEKYSYDKFSKQLYYGYDHIHLSKNETLFLELLLKNPQQLISFDMVDEYIWHGMNYVLDSTRRSLLKNMRKKLPVDFIETVTGLGYRLKRY